VRETPHTQQRGVDNDPIKFSGDEGGLETRATGREEHIASGYAILSNVAVSEADGLQFVGVDPCTGKRPDG